MTSVNLLRQVLKPDNEQSTQILQYQPKMLCFQKKINLKLHAK